MFAEPGGLVNGIVVASMRLHMQLGQPKELLLVLVDVARWSLAQGDADKAQQALARAEALLPAAAPAPGSGSDLAQASLLKYLGEIQTEVRGPPHVSNIQGHGR